MIWWDNIDVPDLFAVLFLTTRSHLIALFSTIAALCMNTLGIPIAICYDYLVSFMFSVKKLYLVLSTISDSSSCSVTFDVLKLVPIRLSFSC